MLEDAWSLAFLNEMEVRPEEDSIYPVPKTVTSAGQRFYWDLRQTLEVLVMMTEVVTFADNAALVSRKLVRGEANLPSNFDPKRPLSQDLGPFRRRLSTLAPILTGTLLVRTVDNFTTYLAEIIRECLLARPEILRSNETVTLEMALRCENMDELRNVLVDRKVDELAYLGFPKLSEWVAKRLGAPELSVAPSNIALLEILEARNCLVHNRGKASAKFVRVTNSSDIAIGDLLPIDLDTLAIAARATAECAELLDGVLSKKFSLERLEARDQPSDSFVRS